MIERREIETFYELKQITDNIYGLNVEVYNNYYYITIDDYCFGLITTDNGIDVDIKKTGNNHYIVTSDSDVYLINPREKQIINKELEGVILDSIIDNNVIIICDLDVYSLDSQTLEEFWIIETHMIKDYILKGNYLYIEQYDVNDIITINIKTGQFEKFNHYLI